MATPSTHPRVLGLGTCPPVAAAQGGLPHIVWEWGDLGSVQGCKYHSVWTRGSLTSTHTLQSYECDISASKEELIRGVWGFDAESLSPSLLCYTNWSGGGVSGPVMVTLHVYARLSGGHQQ